MAITGIEAMERALSLARKGYGKVYPNPMVGAVLVKEGALIGEGWHHGPGSPHAEIEALKSASTDPRGATLYVTLEPCNHFGRTPPCTEAIIQAGIKEVNYAVSDPNPGVTGGGAERLKQAGVRVGQGLKEIEAMRLNKEFFYHCFTGRPWVTMKAGMSLDGKIALANGESRWITGPQSRSFVHRLRSHTGAILIGIGTALKDDPHLTHRSAGTPNRQPLKVLLDSELKLPLESNLVRELPEKLIVFCTAKAQPAKEEALRARGVRVVRQTGRSRVDPAEVLTELGRMGVQSVLLEGGHRVYATFVEAELIQEYYLFYAPFFIGGDLAVGVIGGAGIPSLSEASPLKIDSVRRRGGDVLVHAYGKGWEPACLPDWFKK